jgi:RimJ/RimL family protein N-acetyltransferase
MMEESSRTGIQVIPCADAVLLTEMFLELMTDEQSDSPGTPAQAALCMKEYLARGDRAYTFQAQGVVAGYALVIADRTPLYLRHFYICRDARRRGYGTAAFYALLEALNTETIDLDVFVWNERGKAFWSSLGFAPRATIMRYQAGHDHD